MTNICLSNIACSFQRACFHLPGGQLCLCNHSDGSILVYWGSSFSCHITATCCSLSHAWSHAVQNGKLFQLKVWMKRRIARKHTSKAKAFMSFSRCVCSTWRTLTCCLWVDWWSLWQLNTGTCTNASPWECCSLLVCAQRCRLNPVPGTIVGRLLNPIFIHVDFTLVFAFWLLPLY